MIIRLKLVNILALMAEEDELACAASSVTRLMQTSKTEMTNGNSSTHSKNSNPGTNNPQTKKVPVRYWQRVHIMQGWREGKKTREKESHLFSQMWLWWKACREINFLEACHLLAFFDPSEEKIEWIILLKLGTFCPRQSLNELQHYLVHTLALFL